MNTIRIKYFIPVYSKKLYVIVAHSVGFYMFYNEHIYTKRNQYTHNNRPWIGGEHHSNKNSFSNTQQSLQLKQLLLFFFCVTQNYIKEEKTNKKEVYTTDETKA